MTLKQYKIIKLGFVFALAFIFSQAIYFKNFLIPIALMIVSSLILMLLRRRVKGILADERDYSLGGKAALWAIQIYGWLAASGMFVLYSLRDRNVIYEPVAITLAFSSCILMIIYALIFRYLNRYR